MICLLNKFRTPRAVGRLVQKRQRTGALQDASRAPHAFRLAPAFGVRQSSGALARVGARIGVSSPENPSIEHENESAGMPRTPNASRLHSRVVPREAFGVRRIPPLWIWCEFLEANCRTERRSRTGNMPAMPRTLKNVARVELKRQRTGALQDASRAPHASQMAPAFGVRQSSGALDLGRAWT
ncbi:MAG: hypothetical protein C5B50_07860 [Verrucomicrobia bacterium]|nr:MAG: hypothetical protein C5B50_07860 [Verrucomicrobiota bacterium]